MKDTHPKTKSKSRKLSSKPARIAPAPMDGAASRAPGKARALLVGLTHVNPDMFNGWDGRNGCVGCVADVAAISTVLKQRDWAVVELLDDRATVGNVISGLSALVAKSGPGDSVFFYFSGHGGQVADRNGDEIDGQDETLVCYDGHLVDDRLNEIWLSFPAGVRIYMMSDSCNSGTNFRAIGAFPSLKLRAVSTAAGVDKGQDPLRARMLHLGGCRDGRTSQGLEDGGVFTKSIVSTVAGGFKGTWAELHEIVSSEVSDTQEPAFNLYPEKDTTLAGEICFRPGSGTVPKGKPTSGKPKAGAPQGIPGVPPAGSRLPEGEAMLGRINLAISSRDAAKAAGSRGPGIRLVAEGDSWFDFKIEPDVIDWLRRDYGYEIENLAHAGACVYEMAYGPDDDSLLDIFGRDPSQLEEVVRKIREHKPQAFLFSGGGNDFVGPEFILSIHHAAAKKSGVNTGVVDALFRDEIEPGFRLVIETVTAAARAANLGDIPVILHGYDHAFPDGRSAANLILKKIGPWMHPSFSMKGYPYRNDGDLAVRRAIVATMINTVYDMLGRLANSYPNVRIVDIRGVLPSRSDWHDELHPSRDGFRRVAARFHQVIGSALGVPGGGTRAAGGLPGPPVIRS